MNEYDLPIDRKTMSLDELAFARKEIIQELIKRKITTAETSDLLLLYEWITNDSITIERRDVMNFLVKGNNIRDKAGIIQNLIGIYGRARFEPFTNCNYDQLTFTFETKREADLCEQDLPQILKKLRYEFL